MTARNPRTGRFENPELELQELERLIAELGIYSGSVRAELLEDVPRAIRILGDAELRRRRGELRSPAGYAIARFRSQRAGDLPELETLTVAELEGAREYARRVRLPTPALAAIELELERAQWHAERLEEVRADAASVHVQEGLLEGSSSS